MKVVAVPPPKVPPELAGGDGTVPRVSAVPLTQSKPSDFKGFFPAQQHGALQKDQMVLNDLIERIRLYLAPATENVRGGVGRSVAAPLSLEVQDVYLPNSDVIVYVETPTRDQAAKPPALVARVEALDSKKRQEFGFDPISGNRLAARLDGLKAGGYRIRVSGQGVDATRFGEVDSLFAIDEG